jgi:hypothetical protein
MTRETGVNTGNLPGSEQGTGRGKKRPARKAAKSDPARKFKVTYYLSDEAIQRVGIAATMEHCDKSEVVDRLIQTHLRQWVVSYRGQRSEEAEPAAGRAGEAGLAG